MKFKLGLRGLLATTCFSVVSCLTSISVYAEQQWVENVFISDLEQRIDDEEAPFEFIGRNKVHECGGKTSQRFIMYGEYPNVQQRRFQLALSALLHKKPLRLLVEGCDKKALIVKRLILSPSPQ
ncbi:hypothetical protein [Bermanella sp. R86510]|uniref:hypothetical protein n=1 Tax=unclassified Bermanella TaxID=2627862 RepID=UPI0037C53E8A